MCLRQATFHAGKHLRLTVKIHGVKSHMQVLVEHTHTVTAVRTMMVKMQMFVCVYYDNKNCHEWYASYCTTALPTELRWSILGNLVCNTETIRTEAVQWKVNSFPSLGMPAHVPNCLSLGCWKCIIIKQYQWSVFIVIFNLCGLNTAAAISLPRPRPRPRPRSWICSDVMLNKV